MSCQITTKTVNCKLLMTPLLVPSLILFSLILPNSIQAAKEAPWPNQLNYLGYKIMRTSNINVIRGLNLSSEQAIKLKALAKRLDERIKKPSLNGKGGRAVGEVLKVYGELESKLIAGTNIDEDFRKRVTKARMLNADIIRKGLRYDESQKSCARCHAAPNEHVGVFKKWREGHAADKLLKLELDTAHMRGLLGLEGLAYVWAAADEVDTILSAPQKKAMEGFTCCLTPPKNLTDPTRVGQVGDSDKIIEILQKLRKVPWYLRWYGRRRVTAIVKKFARASNPAITAKQEQQVIKDTLLVVAEAQAMSELDFELHKHELAKRVDLKISKAAKPPQIERFMRAWFLLVPGSTEIYTRLISELNE